MRTTIRTDFSPGLFHIPRYPATKTAKSLRYNFKLLCMPILAQTLHEVDTVAKKSVLPSANVAEFITHTFGFFRSEHLEAQQRCLKKTEYLLRSIACFKSCDFL